MSFRITGLPIAAFRHLFSRTDTELGALNALRVVATEPHTCPDRIELRHAAPGESVILVNYEHQPVNSPYRSRHAVFVLETAAERYDRMDEIPSILRGRDIALRGFDSAGMIADAELVAGDNVEPAIARLLADTSIQYIHAHYAKHGCYACRIDRL